MRSLTIERWITWVLALGVLVLLGIQLSSLYVAPIHDSYLWWGDESWLMNEYRAQMSSGVFRHPHAYGSSLWIGNPFPFTSMWLTSSIYGTLSLLASSASYVIVGRTITALLAIFLLLPLWRKGKGLALSSLSIVIGLGLFISSRSYFLTSHSARYDIISALAIIAIIGKLISELQSHRTKNHFLLGVLWGGSLIVSIHVPLLLALPIAYFIFAQQSRIVEIAKVIGGLLLSVGILYVVHLLTQPVLAGETNLSENLRTIPILRPFSWSVQSSNLVQKWELVLSFAPQILLMLVACAEGLRCKTLSLVSKQAIVLLILPMFGWLLFQPAGPSSYLIHFIPCLALAAMLATESILVGTWQRIALGSVTLLALLFGMRDASMARGVGDVLTREHRSALEQIDHAHLQGAIVAMNPSQSYLHDPPATTHFIELPNSEAERLGGMGYLVTYNSSIQPGFMWEVVPLRAEVTSPDLVLTGRYLDVGRSYFSPLDTRKDTLFLQPLDLTGLYTRHIR